MSSTGEAWYVTHALPLQTFLNKVANPNPNNMDMRARPVLVLMNLVMFIISIYRYIDFNKTIYLFETVVILSH